MRTRFLLYWLSVSCVFHMTALYAQVPQLMNFQGRISVGNTNFSGTGSFKFALVDAAGTTTYWSNDLSSIGGSEPASSIKIAVANGLYSVLLGGTSPIPKTVFFNSDVRLRVWFDDGAHGSQLLAPDQQIATVGFAFTSASLGDVSSGATLGTKGNQLNLQAPGGIKLKTGGDSTGLVLTTSTSPTTSFNVLSIDGDISANDVSLPGGLLTAQAIAVGPGDSRLTGQLHGVGAQFTGNVVAQSFGTTSDRNAKERFGSVKPREILSHLAVIPIETWIFKEGDSSALHIGPMAQDFHAAFQVGSDDKHIATVDADGVAFAAIQGLNEIVQEQNAMLAAKNSALEKRLDQLEKRLNDQAKMK